MRIAFVISSAIKNCRFVEERGAALIERGHTVAFIGWNRYNDTPYTYDSAHIRRFNVHTPLNSASYFLLLPLWWIWTFIQLMLFRPDGVVSINVDSVPACLPYTKLAGKTFVHDLHDFYYYHFEHAPAPIPYLINMLTCAALRSAALVISISKEAIEDFIRRHPRCPSPANMIIYPCLPTPSEYEGLSQHYTNRYDTFTACYFGTIARRRHVYEMTVAVKGLEECNLLIAGPELEKGALAECTSIFPEDGRIQYLGYLMRKDLLERTARSHCIILPLEPDRPHHKIPLPNKVYEAIFCHSPLITTDGTSSADMVKKYSMGIIIPDNTAESIRDAIKSLSDDLERWESCVEGCRCAEREMRERYRFTSAIDALEKEILR